jgi:hypothetical protein
MKVTRKIGRVWSHDASVTTVGVISVAASRLSCRSPVTLPTAVPDVERVLSNTALRQARR